jgi:hypothetical protein
MRKIGILISLFLLFVLFGCNNPGLGPEDYIDPNEGDILPGESTDTFYISSPSGDLISNSTGIPITISVVVPSSTTSVIFSSTLGFWDGTTNTVITKAPANGMVTATLRSNLSGLANVQVMDKNNSGLTDSLTIAFSAPASTATQISLQASATVLAISTNEDKNEVELTAIVRNSNNQAVGGAPVSFSIKNSPGGGETVTPVVTFTDSSGQAKAVFTSGSLPSDPKGVTVTATLVDFPTIQGNVDIIIAGKAGSIIISTATKIQTGDSDTSYTLPISVQVADAGGGGVADAIVSLSVWPIYYRAWDDNWYPNEDVNENLILDPGENLNGNSELIPELTPPAAAAGTIYPNPVVTDERGIATFDLTYLKTSGHYIMVRIRATTMVQGTETMSSRIFVLPVEESEVDDIPPPNYAPPN